MSSSKTIAPIGIIDSGVGGLSVLKEIDAMSCGLTLHYIADSAWCPYGNKSAKLITERVTTHADYLISLGCKTIVIACNSATIASIEVLRDNYPVPFIGMEPAIKPAAKMTQSGVIGVLATEASLAGKKFHNLVNQHGNGVKVITTACPEFVSLVEQSVLTGHQVNQAIEAYVAPLLEQGADTLVLGCTHYPFLRKAIEDFTGDTILVIDTGEAVAAHTLAQAGFIDKNPEGQNGISIYSSGKLSQLQQTFSVLSGGMEADLKKLPYS